MSDIPLCSCGNGKMVLRRAGPEAKNAGRYYYKCPVRGQHSGDFKWADEYHADKPRRWQVVDLDKHQWGDFVDQKPVFAVGGCNGGAAQCCGNKTSYRIVAQVLIGVMCVVLVIIGILIGKVM